jgi:hypothetical protein
MKFASSHQMSSWREIVFVLTHFMKRAEMPKEITQAKLQRKTSCDSESLKYLGY